MKTAIYEKSTTYLINFAEFALSPHKLRIPYIALQNQGVTATSHTSGRRIIGIFSHRECILTDALINKGVTAMNEPDPTTLWNEPFTVNVTVIYITEPCTLETIRVLQ